MDKLKYLKLLKGIGFIVTVISLYFLLEVFLKNFRQLHISASWQKTTYISILVLVFYGITQLNAIWAWHIQLKHNYPEKPIRNYFHILGISQIGKYMPGNFIHLLGRMTLAKKYGFSVQHVSTSLIIETVLLIYPASFAGIIWLALYRQYVDGFNIINLIYLFFLLTGLIILYTSNYMKKRINVVPSKQLLKIICLNILSFISLGMCLYLLQYLFVEEGQQSYSLIMLTVGITVAFVAGFIMPGSPAGIGVREFVFVSLMTPFASELLALSMIIALRVVNVLGDLFLFTLAWVSQKDEV